MSDLPLKVALGRLCLIARRHVDCHVRRSSVLDCKRVFLSIKPTTLMGSLASPFTFSGAGAPGVGCALVGGGCGCASPSPLIGDWYHVGKPGPLFIFCLSLTIFLGLAQLSPSRAFRRTRFSFCREACTGTRQFRQTGHPKCKSRNRMVGKADASGLRRCLRQSCRRDWQSWSVTTSMASRRSKSQRREQDQVLQMASR